MKYLALVLMVLSSGLIGETVQRERTALREGPGAWFPLIIEISKGTEVTIHKHVESWLNVEVGEHRGFISEKALEGKSKSKDIFEQMSLMMPPAKVTHAGVSAAVKGFADKFSSRLESDPELLAYIQNYQPDYHTYAVFKSKTVDQKTLKKLKRKLPLAELKKDKPFTFQEEGSGIAIASKLASMGLVKNPSLELYVNIVGTYVAEQSHGYDIPFRFFILDQDGVNGYACPGGIIFITRGAIEVMESEAELACFLGHEISHVVFRHGMKEMEERKEMIIAGNAFDELSDVTNESAEARQLGNELDDIALESYDLIFRGRLGEYEEEADEIGLLYAARSGYDPNAMLDLLRRMNNNNLVAENEHYSAAQNDLRIKRLKKYLSNKRWKKMHLMLHTERFNKIK